MMPTNFWGGYSPLIGDGTAFGSGLITLSTNGQFIIVCGYATPFGVETNYALDGETGTEVPRVVGVVDGSGYVDTKTVQTNSFADNDEMRSAASGDGTAFWMSGSANGIRYAAYGSPLATQLATSDENTRQLQMVTNALYFSTSSGSTFRIGQAGTQPPPTTNGSTYVELPGIPGNTNSPFGFVLLNLTGGPGPDTLYYTDSNNDDVYKYSLVSGTWTYNDTIEFNATVGLAAQLQISGTTTNVTLYTTGGGNTLSGGDSVYMVIDSGGWNQPANLTSTAYEFDGLINPSGTPGTSFRGIVIFPAGATQSILYSGPSYLSVGPITGFFATDLTCGPFGDSQVFSLANPGSSAINWTANVDSNWVSLSSGTTTNSLAGGAVTTVTATFNGSAASLSAGTNFANIYFSDVSGTDITTQQVRLILSPQSISPSSAFASSGPPGGPFSPTNDVYTLSNGCGTVSWIATNTQSWLTISPTSGTLGQGQGVTITATVNSVANSLAAGAYSDVITFSNATAGTVIDTRNVSLGSGFVYWFDDFSTYVQNEPVAGQNGWTQLGSTASLPPTIVNGALVENACAVGVSGQTVYKNFPLITNPVTFVGAVMTVTSVPQTNGSPNYMSVIYNGNNGTATSGTYGDYRFAPVGTNDFAHFLLGARCTGQVASWTFGAQSWPTGTVLRVIEMTSVTATSQTVYVNPTSADLGAQTPYAISYLGGNAADEGAGSFGLSGEYGGTVGSAGALFWKLAASTNYAQVYSFLTNCPAFSLSPSGTSPYVLTAGTAGTSYSQAITAEGVVAPYTFAVTSGALPGGLGLSSAGEISGTPTATGTFPFTVTATNAIGCTSSQAYSLTVTCTETILLSPDTGNPTPLTATAGTPYSQTISATGGTAPYTYAVTAGSLTGSGLTLSSAGVLSGASPVQGTYTFTVTATDSVGCSDGQAYSLTVSAGTPPFSQWEENYGLTNCAACGGNASYTGDGMSNTNKFLAGFNLTNSAAYLHIISVARVNNGKDIQVTYLGANGDNSSPLGALTYTNILDYTTGTTSGGYSNINFATAGVTNILSGGNGYGMVTNMIDAGGATNVPSRYYRVRVLVP
jgi:hypothetical protein